jgi:IclR family transcriptional regulator, KDG regulon repressor
MKNKAKRSSSQNRRPVKSLMKALRILDTLGDHPRGMRLTELSDSLKAPKSTIHRLIATLAAAGYIIFDMTTSKYILGSRLARLGEQLNQQSSLLTFGVPALEDLTRVCGEASHLAILEGTEVVFISREEANTPMRISFGMGHRAPAHCTALGKIFLAALSDGEISSLYKNKRRLDPLTPSSIATLTPLLSEIAVVRKEVIAHDNQEYMAGLYCMAAPVRDFSCRVIAAMSLSVFKHRLTPQRKAFLKSALIRASVQLSEKLGFQASTKKIAI